MTAHIVAPDRSRAVTDRPYSRSVSFQPFQAFRKLRCLILIIRQPAAVFFDDVLGSAFDEAGGRELAFEAIDLFLNLGHLLLQPRAFGVHIDQTRQGLGTMSRVLPWASLKM